MSFCSWHLSNLFIWKHHHKLQLSFLDRNKLFLQQNIGLLFMNTPFANFLQDCLRKHQNVSTYSCMAYILITIWQSSNFSGRASIKLSCNPCLYNTHIRLTQSTKQAKGGWRQWSCTVVPLSKTHIRFGKDKWLIGSCTFRNSLLRSFRF